MVKFFKVLLLLFSVAVAVNGAIRVRRVIGGTNAEINNFPYVAAILKNSSEFVCGGVIISPTKILTLASCLHSCFGAYDCTNSSVITVVTGSAVLSKGGTVHHVKSVKRHESFDKRKALRANNIGIITLKSEIKFDDKQKAIDLPDKDAVANTVANFTGWGTQDFLDDPDGHSNILQYAIENIISHDQCNDFYKNNGFSVDLNDMCTLGESSLCTGDGGSPLVQNGKLIGLSSYAATCKSDVPEVYTNVYKFLNFIKEELK